MEYHRISFIHNDTEYSFVKAMSSSLTGYALVTACRAEVTIYMKENNLKGYYILTGMAKVWLHFYLRTLSFLYLCPHVREKWNYTVGSPQFEDWGAESDAGSITWTSYRKKRRYTVVTDRIGQDIGLSVTFTPYSKTERWQRAGFDSRSFAWAGLTDRFCIQSNGDFLENLLLLRWASYRRRKEKYIGQSSCYHHWYSGTYHRPSV